MSKLRDKLLKTIQGMAIRKGMNEITDDCEQITDDFAVKFAEFQIGLLIKQINNVFYFDYDAEWITTTELLQIFKDKYYDR